MSQKGGMTLFECCLHMFVCVFCDDHVISNSEKCVCHPFPIPLFPLPGQLIQLQP